MKKYRHAGNAVMRFCISTLELKTDARVPLVGSHKTMEVTQEHRDVSLAQ